MADTYRLPLALGGYREKDIGIVIAASGKGRPGTLLGYGNGKARINCIHKVIHGHLHEVTRSTDFRLRTYKTFGFGFWFPSCFSAHATCPNSAARNGSTALQSRIRLFCARTRREARTLLYFAYNARIGPDQMAAAAPGANFQFIAHLPEWGLGFPIADSSWGGALPAIRPEPGSTVWGAVYEIGKADLGKLNELETTEQRSSATIEAMDRTGRRHQVIVHLLEGAPTTNGNGSHRPSSKYLELMLAGSRHWSLPVGWIAGLEEHLENGA